VNGLYKDFISSTRTAFHRTPDCHDLASRIDRHDFQKTFESGFRVSQHFDFVRTESGLKKRHFIDEGLAFFCLPK
jgi:hypothetical protein